jgi:hypothetical protein
MALLKKSYSEVDTVKTELRSVEVTHVSKTHKIIKSTDSDLPSGIEWIGTNGDLQNGVWEIEGVFYAMILTFETTIEQVKESKLNQILQSARSKISAIDVLDDDAEAQKQVIKDDLAVKQAELEAMTTIQEAEAVTV